MLNLSLGLLGVDMLKVSEVPCNVLMSRCTVRKLSCSGLPLFDCIQYGGLFAFFKIAALLSRFMALVLSDGSNSMHLAFTYSQSANLRRVNLVLSGFLLR